MLMVDHFLFSNHTSGTINELTAVYRFCTYEIENPISSVAYFATYVISGPLLVAFEDWVVFGYYACTVESPYPRGHPLGLQWNFLRTPAVKVRHKAI